MRIVIIEDELPAAKRLVKLLDTIDDSIEIVGRFDSIDSSVIFFTAAPAVDLVFMDIQLADGLSFDIFSKVSITAPVIFITAFDQYTLRAFKVNSVDYLLKPIDENELRLAVEKYKKIFAKSDTGLPAQIYKLVQEMQVARFRERLLVKRGQQLSYIKTDGTAYCYADGKLCYAVDFNGNRYLLESKLAELEDALPPNRFYRINRSLVVNIEAVKKVHTWFGGRLKLDISPLAVGETFVSRERVAGFKEWLGR